MFKNGNFTRCIIVCTAVFCCISCGTSMKRQYQEIKNSGLTGQELLETLTSFELDNPSHFDSKIDLAGYYMLTGDFTRAREYLKRAEPLIGKAEDTENKGRLYALLAQIYLYSGEYDTALTYIRKTGGAYQFVEANILTALKRNAEALALFDTAFAKHGSEASPEDLQAYMYLLADSERNAECEAVLERFFKTGRYFPGLGLFASTLYEKTGRASDSVYAAFLDYEFMSSYNQSEDKRFLDNLYKLETRIIETPELSGAQDAVIKLRSLFESSLPLCEDAVDGKFFAEQYVILKNRTQRGRVSRNDFSALMGLEPWLNKFPAYYWTVWQALQSAAPEQAKNFTPILEKTVALAPSGPYNAGARSALCKLAGVPQEQAGNLLLPPEVESALKEYLKTGDYRSLDRVFALLSVNDNAYTLAAVQILKQYHEAYNLTDLCTSVKKQGNQRLQERISYILQ